MVALKSVFFTSLAIVSMVFIVGCSSSGGGNESLEGLSIKAAVYDNNKTSTVSDDRLYIYFDKSINIDTIKDDISSNFDINGTGSFGDSFAVDYNDSMFHRLKITLADDVNTTEFITESTTIALSKESALKKSFTINNIPVTITSPKTVLTIGPRTYTDVNGTVTDDATGLIWQQEDDGSLQNWNSAKTYCEALTLDGLTWRLPTIDELIGLTDKNASYPTINPIFTNTKNSQYWTGSEYLGSSADDAWSVNFADANTNNPDKNTTLYVRCVSSDVTTTSSSYTRDSVNEVVLDTSTNLMWEDTPNTIDPNNSKNWNDAIVQCENLDLAGYDDWKLPNINELDTIADKTTYGPAMSSEFKYKASAIFWSSTTQEYNTNNAWYTYFYCGCNDFKDKTTKSQVRCVRSVD